MMNVLFVVGMGLRLWCHCCFQPPAKQWLTIFNDAHAPQDMSVGCLSSVYHAPYYTLREHPRAAVSDMHHCLQALHDDRDVLRYAESGCLRFNEDLLTRPAWFPPSGAGPELALSDWWQHSSSTTQGVDLTAC